MAINFENFDVNEHIVDDPFYLQYEEEERAYGDDVIIPVDDDEDYDVR